MGERRNLKETRKAAGMTQQQVADKLNISLVYYHERRPVLIEKVF